MTQLNEVEALIEDMAGRLSAELERRHVQDPVMVGIHTGGAWVAQRLHDLLAIGEPLGTLDISFYRDDFSRAGMHPRVRPSNLPFTVEDRTVVLVDDVLYSGRTVRAAMNEIFDYGRPGAILLAVLVDRGGRELPIRADVAGRTIDLNAGEQVKLVGPDPLELTIRKAS